MGALAALYGIAWLAWILMGLSSSQLHGWHNFALALMALIPGVALAAVALIDAVPWFNPNGPKAFRRALRLARWKRKNLVSTQLKIAFGLWLAMLMIASGFAWFGNIQTLGMIGDAFNVLTCLFIAVGFHFTIRQIQSEHEAGSEEKRRHRESIRAQERIAGIEFGKMLVAQEEVAMKLAESYQVKLDSCNSALESEIRSPQKFGFVGKGSQGLRLTQDLASIPLPTFENDMLRWISLVLKHQDTPVITNYKASVQNLTNLIKSCKKSQAAGEIDLTLPDLQGVMRDLQFVLLLLRMARNHHFEIITIIQNKMASGELFYHH